MDSSRSSEEARDVPRDTRIDRFTPRLPSRQSGMPATRAHQRVGERGDLLVDEAMPVDNLRADSVAAWMGASRARFETKIHAASMCKNKPELRARRLLAPPRVPLSVAKKFDSP